MLSSNSTTEALFSLGATIDFIYFWIKCVGHNYLARSNMYIETMHDFFNKTPVQLTKPLRIKEKHKSLLHDIGGDWYTKKINEKFPPLKKTKTE